MIMGESDITINADLSEARILLADDDSRMLDSLSGLLKLYDFQGVWLAWW